MTRSIKKRIAKSLVAVMTVAMPLTATLGVTLPTSTAHANLLGGIIGAVTAGISASQTEKELEKIDTDEESRQELLKSMEEQQGVNSDPDLNARLDSIMSNLSSSIATIDPTINDKPYIYFINNDTSFNAACSLGHVMTVNTGMFDLVNSDDEIAVVLGHEMGHGQKGHVLKGFKKSISSQILAGAIAGGTGTQLGSAAASVVANYTYKVNITKPNEWEADNLAFDYISNSNYNPGACAAVWQRVIEKYGDNSSGNFVGEIFSPSDHPTHEQRRENYENKLKEFSHNHVTVANGQVKVNDKDFISPAATSSMSTAERSYFVAGNLARIYHNNETPSEATVSNGTVYMDDHAVMTAVDGDATAEDIAAKLNTIK